MEIISLEFAFFVIISLAVFYLLPGKMQNPFLLLASYYFYISWDWRYAVVLAALTLFNFFYAQFLGKNIGGETSPGKLRLLLWAGVGLNLAVFLVFLFGGPLSKALSGLLGGRGFETTILLPLGFSYYVLECISYLIDIRLKIAKPTRNLVDFALYLAYFPKLVSGPIERARTFLPQLAEKHTVDNATIGRSLALIVLGLTQTIILAGTLSFLVPMSRLLNPEEHSAWSLIIGLAAYMIFLYNQFSGYTRLVRGISGLFGIQLTSNFAYPLFSKDFSDFWKRWHISLSQWLRDYIYMPMSRSFLRRNPSRSNKANLILPPLATMLASGLWHGGSLHLFAWGALNGVYIVSENLITLFKKATPGKKQPVWRQLISSLLVQGLAGLAVLPFMFDLGTVKIYLYQMVYGWAWELPDLRPLFIIALSLILDWIPYRANDELVFIKWHKWSLALATSLALIGMVILYEFQSAPATFIYP